jgi:polyisoprenyl-teichoic acid--peptidoglycan teichoic acid transferase
MSDLGGGLSRDGRRSDKYRKKTPRSERLSSQRRGPSEIRRVEPRTSGAETSREATRRRRQSSKIVTPEVRHRKRRRRLTIAAIVVAVLVLGGAAGAYAFISGISTTIHDMVNQDQTIVPQLKPVAVGKPFYMVIMGVDTRPGEGVARSDTLIVAYVDPQRKRVTTMSIPRDTRVTISGRGTAKINEAMQLGGPSLVIKTVKTFTGLPISHFAYINFEGFKDIVDAMGGVDVYVSENIQDLQASGNHRAFYRIYKGWQHLDGGHALTFVRARHQYADQDFSRMKNQQTFMKALVKKAMTVNPLMMPALATSVAKNVKTDLSLEQVIQLAQNFRGMDDKMFQSVTMPGHPEYIGGISYVVADMDAFRAATAKMEKGELFTAVASTTTSPTVKPGDITINVRNGAGVTGLAKIVGDKLRKDGFRIKDMANMGQYVYGETLIVFSGDANTAKATAVSGAMGVGKVVKSNGMYRFDADIMVIIGKDFDPKKFGTSTVVRH